MAREHFERDQVEANLRSAMANVDAVERFLDGDFMAGPYEHDGSADALHHLDTCREALDGAATALHFDPAVLRRPDL